MSQEFVPENQNIIAVAVSGKNTIVTTEEDHSFVVGNTVTFIVPSDFKMIELNDREANVIAITNDTITVDINSTRFTAFSVPAQVSTPAQVMPIGSTNFGFEVQGTIPEPITIAGAFRIIEN